MVVAVVGDVPAAEADGHRWDTLVVEGGGRRAEMPAVDSVLPRGHRLRAPKLRGQTSASRRWGMPLGLILPRALTSLRDPRVADLVRRAAVGPTSIGRQRTPAARAS